MQYFATLVLDEDVLTIEVDETSSAAAFVTIARQYPGACILHLDPQDTVETEIFYEEWSALEELRSILRF